MTQADFEQPPFSFQPPPGVARDPNPLTNFGEQPPPARKPRGPSRKLKPPAAESTPKVAKNKGGRPRTAKPVVSEEGVTPAAFIGPSFRLQDLVGLQAEDVEPLANAWKVLMPLKLVHRARVLGLLAKVLA